MSAFARIADRLSRRQQERARRLRAAVRDHMEWVKRSWPKEVRRKARNGRPAPRHTIVAEGGEIGWTVFGSPTSSKARFQKIKQRWLPKKDRDLRRRLTEALEGAR